MSTQPRALYKKNFLLKPKLHATFKGEATLVIYFYIFLFAGIALMSLDASAAKEIKTQMAIARKRELAFGLCFGKKLENSVLIIHKTKASKVLGKQAKTEGETPQCTFGRLTLKGKDLSVSLDGKILPGFARKAKKMFMWNRGQNTCVHWDHVTLHW